MGAFALFSVERSSRYVGTVIASRSIARESSLEGREEQLRLEREAPNFVKMFGSLLGEVAGVSDEKVEKAKRDIATNSGQEFFGLFVATIHMPRADELRRLINEHPMVDGFLSLDRKEKRAILKAEKKNSG
jgi:hypothetical protein